MPDKIPCETCGTPTDMGGTKRCDGCWEVEHRLADYLQTKGGRVFVSDALAFAIKNFEVKLAYDERRLVAKALRHYAVEGPHTDPFQAEYSDIDTHCLDLAKKLI